MMPSLLSSCIVLSVIAVQTALCDAWCAILQNQQRSALLSFYMMSPDVIKSQYYLLPCVIKIAWAVIIFSISQFMHSLKVEFRVVHRNAVLVIQDICKACLITNTGFTWLICHSLALQLAEWLDYTMDASSDGSSGAWSTKKTSSESGSSHQTNSASFTITLSNEDKRKSSSHSLQESFLQYKKRRQVSSRVYGMHYHMQSWAWEN